MLKCKQLKLSLTPALNLLEATVCTAGKESLLIPLGHFLQKIKGKAAWLYLEVQVKAGILLPWRPGAVVLQDSKLLYFTSTFQKKKGEEDWAGRRKSGR